MVYEDRDTIAFLDINPVNPGHTLVIPKEHHVNVFDAPEDTWQKIMSTSKKVAGAIKTAIGTEHLNITMNNGVHSGQVVFHAHIHLIPRHEGDGYEQWHGHEYADGEAITIAEKIKNAL